MSTKKFKYKNYKRHKIEDIYQHFVDSYELGEGRKVTSYEVYKSDDGHVLIEMVVEETVTIY